MQIQDNTLATLLERDVFVRTYSTYVTDVLQEGRLYPRFAIRRLVEAHGAWREDLDRVSKHEPNLSDGMDHFKQCGHLAFWLRRMSPLVDVIDLTSNLGDAEGMPISQDEQEFRDLLFGYANEYLALDFGYQICKYHELAKPGSSTRATALRPGTEWYITMCQFLKYKTVSPHALFLIYKSLFLEG